MNILRIALNEVRIVLKDRQILLWWLAMPLAFVFIFSFTVNDYTSDGIYLPVLQYDDHELADLFIEQLHGEGYWVQIRPREDEALISEWPRALIIPENFSQSILQGQRVDLILAEGSDTPERSISAKALLARVLVKLNTAVAAIDLVERGWNPETKKQDLNFTPARGSAVARRYMERHVAPTIESRQLIAAANRGARPRPAGAGPGSSAPPADPSS